MDKVGIEAHEFDFLFGRSTSRSMGTPLIDASSPGMYECNSHGHAAMHGIILLTLVSGWRRLSWTMKVCI
jgi:hypothetical protein